MPPKPPVPAVKRAVVGCLLAHPKGWSTDKIKPCVEWLNGWLRDQSTPERKVIANVHSAQAEWYRTYSNGLETKAWVKSVLTRTSSVLGTRQYKLVVVPGLECGATTAVIVEQALLLNLSVKALVRGGDGKPCLKNVASITIKDPKNLETGWGLTLKE